MSPAPSLTLDIETATAFRDWLFETGIENHAEPQIADPLAELAAAIDGELYDSTECVAISASTTAFPLDDQCAVVDDAGSPTQQESEDSTRPADGIPVNAPTATSTDLRTISPTTRGTAHSTSIMLTRTASRRHAVNRHRRQQLLTHRENGIGCRFNISLSMSARYVAASGS